MASPLKNFAMLSTGLPIWSWQTFFFYHNFLNHNSLSQVQNVDFEKEYGVHGNNSQFMRRKSEKIVFSLEMYIYP